MTVRLVNPQDVSFAGTSLPGCREVRLITAARGLRWDAGDGEIHESHVEASRPRHFVEIVCEDVVSALGVTAGARGALSFKVAQADGSGTVSVSTASAVATGGRTRFRNEAAGVSVTTLRFVCRSVDGVSSPISIG